VFTVGIKVFEEKEHKFEKRIGENIVSVPYITHDVVHLTFKKDLKKYFNHHKYLDRFISDKLVRGQTYITTSGPISFNKKTHKWESPNFEMLYYDKGFAIYIWYGIEFKHRVYTLSAKMDF
jgi:hypothetical protein